MDNSTTNVYREWLSGKRYQSRIGLDTSLVKFREFYEGNQWPEITENTKWLPRPVFNICKKFVETKTAILLEEISKKDLQSIEIQNLKSLNEKAIEDAAVLGTSILHLYYDTFKQAVIGEVINPLSIIFADPLEKNVQKQPFIIIESLKLTDDKTESADLVKINGYSYLRILTKYYKDEKGQVWFIKATKTKFLSEAKALMPGSRFNLYPICIYNWDNRGESIYGIGEIEALIPTQKSINWLYAMNILSAQDTAWGKYIVKPGALKQSITNQPGEIIVDNYIGGEGIKLLQPAGINPGTLTLLDKINSMASNCHSVSDTLLTDSIKNMSAETLSAIIAEQKRPLLNKLEKYFVTLEEAGLIADLFKKYY